MSGRGSIMALALSSCAAWVAAAGPPFIPNDPDFDLQWAFRNTGQVAGDQAGVVGADIDAPGAWAIHRGTPGVTVAIVGRGVDPHPEFADRLLAGRAFAGDLFDTFDSCAQDTHLAGIIAAGTDNGMGVAGVNGRAMLLPVRVFDGCLGTPESTAAGVNWAVDHGADVILVTTTFPSPSEALRQAVDGAFARDVVVIAHSGATGEGGVTYPAAYASCIAVTATTNRDTIASVSNFGQEVEIAAPGTDIWSTWLGGGFSLLGSGREPLAASAFVAGVASLVRSFAPRLTAVEVRGILTDAADDLGQPGRDPIFGVGRLNARRALELASPSALRFEHIDAIPMALPPGRPAAFVVRLAGAGGSVRAGLVFVRFRIAGDTSFGSAPLTPLGDDRFLAMLPGFNCGDEIEFFLLATGEGGTAVTDPPRGGLHRAVATVRSPVFSDDFETDKGWEAIGGNNTNGRWSRVVPVGTSAQPGFDFSPGLGRRCFVTGQHFGGSDGTNDVDGGPVLLVSPVIPLPPPTPDHDIEVSYARWFAWSIGQEDFLTVEFSRDGGTNWSTVETVASTSAWVETSFRLSDFPGVTGDALRVRFSASDVPADSLTEAAIDEFRVDRLPCPAAPGDANFDGAIDLSDYTTFAACLTGPRELMQRGACAVADFDDNLSIDLADYRRFQNERSLR